MTDVLAKRQEVSSKAAPQMDPLLSLWQRERRVVAKQRQEGPAVNLAA